MQLQYDDDFVESAVFLRAAGRSKFVPPRQIARFHRERERLYSFLDPDERNASFFKLHMEWFREWGLERLLTTRLQEFPILHRNINILAFRKTHGKRDEGAELYVNESGDRTGVVSLRPEDLQDESKVAGFLCHEFSHLQDMVDPAFGYTPELKIPLTSISQQRLVRERYGVLWDTSIDGRLLRARRPTVATREQRWLDFSNAFGFWPEAKQQEVFVSVWNNPIPAHKQFEQLVCDPRQFDSTAGPQSGALCPLCEFPTFAWAEPESFVESLVTAIRREFPHWSPAQGACGRCLEIYHGRHLQEARAR